MIQQQQNQTFEFIPILQTTSVSDNQLPSLSSYIYDIYTKTINKISKFVNVDQFSYVPFYTANLKISNTSEFLITGGALLNEENNIYQSTNNCIKVSIQQDSIIFQTYNTLQNQTYLPSLIQQRHNHKIFELQQNGKKVFIVVGGQQINNDQKNILKSCEMLIEDSNQWIEIAQINKQRTGFSGFVQNNKIYIFGGVDSFEKDKVNLIPISSIEVYDINTNKWDLLKIKCPLGIQIAIDSCCLPIDDKKVLILGGAKEKSSQQILIYDIQTQSITKSNSKLDNPKAKAQGQYFENVKMKKIIRTDVNETVEEENKNIILILGGSHDQLFLEIYEYQDENKIILLQKQDLSQLLDQDYEISDLSTQNSWIFAMQSLPILMI